MSVSATILIVEDDRGMARLLWRLVVGALGHHARLATSGAEAIELARASAPTAIVLDVVLPDMDGYEVARRLRGAGFSVPIVMVSVNDSPADEVAGFAAGADDYIGKPFHVDVFVARLTSAIRRGVASGAARRAGDLSLDVLQRRADCRGVSISLSPLEFAILLVLVDNDERTVSLRELARRAWGHADLGASNTYHVAVQRLRRRLERAGSSVVIETVRSEGYRLAFTARRVADDVAMLANSLTDLSDR